MINYKDYITIEPNKKSGKACVRGLRIMVSDVLGYLAVEMSAEEIIEEWEELTIEDIRACLAFAADN